MNQGSQQPQVSQGEALLAEELRQKHLDLAMMMNEIARRDEQISTLKQGYDEMREVLTQKQREKLGLA